MIEPKTDHKVLQIGRAVITALKENYRPPPGQGSPFKLVDVMRGRRAVNSGSRLGGGRLGALCSFTRLVLVLRCGRARRSVFFPGVGMRGSSLTVIL